MKGIVKIILLLILLIGCTSQEKQPEDIARLFFSEDTTGISKYLCCDMIKEPDEEYQKLLDSLESNMQKPDGYPDIETELVQKSDSEVVVAVNLTLDTITEDAYLFFKLDNGWKLEAVRALAYTGLYVQLIKEYESSSQDDIDKFMKMDMHYDIRKMYYQSKLIVSSDRELIEHQRNNKELFNNLLREVKSSMKPGDEYNADKSDSLQSIFELSNKLLISQIYRDINSPIDIKTPGITYFLIGGVLDNTAGYMYIENDKEIPKMSKNGFIIIREIGEGWYFYKTT